MKKKKWIIAVLTVVLLIVGALVCIKLWYKPANSIKMYSDITLPKNSTVEESTYNVIKDYVFVKVLIESSDVETVKNTVENNIDFYPTDENSYKEFMSDYDKAKLSWFKIDVNKLYCAYNASIRGTRRVKTAYVHIWLEDNGDGTYYMYFAKYAVI